MLLDFDDSWVSGKEGCKEACADKPTNMYWEAQKGMPYIVTNVPEQSRLLNFPALIPGCCTAIKWVVTHPADGIVHIAATATTCFLAYSCGSTLYHHWPIDCAFGVAVRLFFILGALLSLFAIDQRIKNYKLAPIYKTSDTAPENQARIPFVQLRYMKFNTFTKLNMLHMWSLVPTLYVLFIGNRAPGCSAMCCPPEGVKVDSTLPWGGGAPIMVDATITENQLYAYAILFPLMYLVLNVFSRDPVEDESWNAFNRKRMQMNPGGG